MKQLWPRDVLLGHGGAEFLAEGSFSAEIYDE